MAKRKSITRAKSMAKPAVRTKPVKGKSAADEFAKVWALPFVDANAKKARFWTIRYVQGPTDADYAIACEVGAGYARLAVQTMRDTKFTPLLGSIARSQIARGKYDGVEVGFWQYISELATWEADR